MSGKRKRKDRESVSGGSEETFREYRGTKVRRLDAEVTRGGGVPLGAASLSLRTNLEALLRAIATIGAGARGVAREYLSDHLFQVMDELIALAVQKKDRAAAQWAAQVLSALLYRCIGPVIDIAESEAQGKKWAGESLAWIEDAFLKHGEKLKRVNKAYCDTKKRIQELGLRADVVADPGVIGQIVQKELAVAELYWGQLRFYRRLFGDGWEKEISTEIPRDYFAFEPLRAFNVESCQAWWKLLWPLIKKNNPDFLVGVREGRFPTLGIRKHARWSRYGDDFRGPLETLAGLRS